MNTNKLIASAVQVAASTMAAEMMRAVGIKTTAANEATSCSSRKLRRAGIARKPAPEQQEQQEQPQKNGLIRLHSGQEFVLIFECSHKDIPKGVQILPLTGGGKADISNQSDTKKPDVRISIAKVDLNSLLERVSVNSVNVTDRAGYIVVYVNCTVEKTKDSGFNHWGGGIYEAFVKRALSQTWNRTIIKDESVGRTSLTLRKGVSKQYETKIRFAIE